MGQIPRDPIFRSFRDLEDHAGLKVKKPEKASHIRHVILDADDTIWAVHPWGLISSCKPVGRSTGNTVTAEAESFIPLKIGKPIITKVAGTINLDPTLRDTLKKLKEKGIGVSIASQNEKKAVEAALDAFGLLPEISNVEAGWGTSKVEMVYKIAAKENLRTEEILFVDDSPNHVEDVEDCTDAVAVQKYNDIFQISDILEMIE